VQFKASDTIEFKRGDMKQRGNVIRIENDKAIVNLFAACVPPGKWYYMGVSNETPILLKDIEECIVIES
jgi:hypothetical protein